MIAKSNLKSILLKFLLLFLLCLLLGLVDAFRSYVSANRNGVHLLDLDVALRSAITGWMSWMFLTPLVLWLCRRFPLDEKKWKTRILLFIPIGLVLSLIRVLFPFLIGFLFSGRIGWLLNWLPQNYLLLATDYSFAFIFFSLVVTFGQAINYYKRYREEELRASKLELQLSQAQLQALKMQLQPHFLFNTLNSISALQHENVELAQEMTARLGDFLRMTLQNIGTQEVTLQREIEFLQCYLDIEKVRFGQKLQTNIDIETQVLDCQVPNLILQPLVENAIKHGIAPNKHGGHINIRGGTENGWLKVEIEDSGKGITDEKLEKVFSSGLGLANTKERLTQLYGSNFRFEVQNTISQGFLVTLCLPNSSKK